MNDKSLNDKHTSNTIILGGGCFWCIEAVFLQIEGIIEVVSGYAGSDEQTDSPPNYYSHGDNAEAIKLTFDANIIKLNDILDIFFSVHDPTTMDRQGADVGRQYRSIILAADHEQEKEIKNYIINNISPLFESKVVTEIKTSSTFYKAEDYHQNYYNQNKDNFYCQVVIDPKLNKLRQHFNEFLKPKSVH